MLKESVKVSGPTWTVLVNTWSTLSAHTKDELTVTRMINAMNAR